MSLPVSIHNTWIHTIDLPPNVKIARRDVTAPNASWRANTNHNNMVTKAHSFFYKYLVIIVFL